MFHIGCIAHILNLSLNDLFDTDEGYQHLIEFDEIIKEIYSFFSVSPKRIIDLQNWFKMEN